MLAAAVARPAQWPARGGRRRRVLTAQSAARPVAATRTAGRVHGRADHGGRAAAGGRERARDRRVARQRPSRRRSTPSVGRDETRPGGGGGGASLRLFFSGAKQEAAANRHCNDLFK